MTGNALEQRYSARMNLRLGSFIINLIFILRQNNDLCFCTENCKIMVQEFPLHLFESEEIMLRTRHVSGI